MTNEDDFTTPAEGSPTWIAELRRRCPTPEETDALCDRAERLAAIERQVLWRTEDMPEDAVGWGKRFGHTYWLFDGGRGFIIMGTDEAPDYRHHESGPIWLPILDPPA